MDTGQLNLLRVKKDGLGTAKQKETEGERESSNHFLLQYVVNICYISVNRRSSEAFGCYIY